MSSGVFDYIEQSNITWLTVPWLDIAEANDKYKWIDNFGLKDDLCNVVYWYDIFNWCYHITQSMYNTSMICETNSLPFDQIYSSLLINNVSFVVKCSCNLKLLITEHIIRCHIVTVFEVTVDKVNHPRTSCKYSEVFLSSFNSLFFTFILYSELSKYSKSHYVPVIYY